MHNMGPGREGERENEREGKRREKESVKERDGWRKKGEGRRESCGMWMTGGRDGRVCSDLTQL